MTKRALLLVFGLPFLGCDSPLNCTEGSGVVTTVPRQTGSFQAVRVEGNFEVLLRRDAQPSIRIEADSNLHRHITTIINRDELEIATDGCITPSRPVRVFLSAPIYHSLEVEGSGSISSEELLSTGEDGLLELFVDGSGSINLNVFSQMVKSDIDGSGSITLKGTTQAQLVKLEGSGKYSGFELKAQETMVKSAGSGDVEVYSTGALNVNHSGSGTVRYKGSPSKLSSDVTGSGKLMQE